MKKVVIMGAGVGGLTCAHQLSKLDYDVYIIERNDEIGGQARTKRNCNGLHSEYCWHVVGKTYNNLWKILKEIPLEEKIDSSDSEDSYSPDAIRTVADNLKPITKYIYGRYTPISNKILEEDNTSFLCSNSMIEYVKALYAMQTLDKISLYDFFKLVEIYTLSNIHNLDDLEKYDNVLWKNFTQYMSEEAKKWIADSPAIYLGMDIDKLSTHTMLHLLRPVISGDLKHDFYTFNGPFNEKWFGPWEEFLRWRGVKFIKGTVNKIRVVDNKIEYIKIGNNKIIADYYINAMSVESLGGLLTQYKELSDKSVQIQTQVLYYIDKRLNIGISSIIILPDTEWCLMIRPEGYNWEKPTIEEDSNTNKHIHPYRDILSLGIGIWSRPGLNGKCANKCTIDEIVVECWRQLCNNTTLMNHIKLEGGGSFKDVNVVESDVWDSFQFNEDAETIETFEPKFSNNVGVLTLRPKTKDEVITNLLHATAYTRTNANIFNMESACEAGCRAAYEINNGLNYVKTRDNPSTFFKFIQSL